LTGATPRAPNLGADGADVEPTDRRNLSRVHEDSAAPKIGLESCRLPTASAACASMAKRREG
jgi:hypothetical protein